eukprot:COSAG02_NODE_5221_length_4527_cov_1.996613_2_plen_66_part_00
MPVWFGSGVPGAELQGKFRLRCGQPIIPVPEHSTARLYKYTSQELTKKQEGPAGQLESIFCVRDC